MILNISGRTDIIAFYTPWFLKRIEEGFVDVRNPMYPKKVSRIYFEDVSLFVFCTKNPMPIIPYLKNINKPIIFQITLTPYKKDIEPNVIDKRKIITGIKKISKIIGIENIYLRYDPILINDKYTITYHKKAFLKLCQTLEGEIKHIIISFIDNYKNVKNNNQYLKLQELNESDIKNLLEYFSKVANMHNISVQSCYESDYSSYGILNIPCISKEIAYEKTHKKYPKWSARDCGCIKMVDIGAYNSCNHLCKYCYANYNELQVKNNILTHDVNSSLLLGNISSDDEISIRK